ncbi:MAG: hypothetical protein ACYYK0_06625 [Candidatus Eutrophobiaceae bacterium]
MSDDDIDNQDSTEAKTVWTESLFDGLYAALENGRKRAVIVDIVKDLIGRGGYTRNFLVEKVRKKLGDKTAIKFEEMITPKSKATEKKKKARGVAERRLASSKRATAKKEANGPLLDLWSKIKKLWNNITKA